MLSLIPPAYAGIGEEITITQPSQVAVTNIGTIVSGAIGFAFIIAGALVFGYLVWGGIQWIPSGGDKANLETARSRITNALVGLVIIVTSYALVKILEYIFDYDILGVVSIPTWY